MLNQSFDYENLLKIIYNENNKGFNLELRYFSELRDDIEQLRKINKLIRDNRKNKTELKVLYKKKSRIKERKDGKLKKALTRISKNLSSNKYEIIVTERNQINNKPIYTLEDNIENLFISKQLQKNLYKLYKIKQSNRQIISEQVKCILQDGFPKYIIKTDIKNCYESIDQNKLIGKLIKDNLLSTESKKHIRRIIKEYNKLSIKNGGGNTGLPRGIGISAYLAEIYLRQVDRIVKKLDNVIYYARYVDDIIIILLPEMNKYEDINNIEGIKNGIKNKIKDETGLELNESKTDCSTYVNFDFDYLGYNYKWNNADKGNLDINLSKKKFDRYEKRIHVSFDNYNKFKKINEKAARKILIQRIRFLTGNTRIVSYNKSFFAGIYYSCPLLNTNILIEELDNILETESKKLKSSSIKKRLSKYKFKTGFNEKRFSPFSFEELKSIVKIWKKS